MVFWIVAILFLGMFAYVRLAPSDLARWHVVPQVTGNKDFKRGVTRMVENVPRGLRRFDNAARSDPRTQVLAGSVEDGLITYISRSRMVGFPDYTTAMQAGDDLLIYGRQRFGRSDLGVNAARVDRWLKSVID